MHRDSHVGVVKVLGVEEGEDVEHHDKKHEFWNRAFRNSDLPAPEDLSGIDRCHQADADLNEEALRGVEGIVEDVGQDKDRHKKGQD